MQFASTKKELPCYVGGSFLSNRVCYSPFSLVFSYFSLLSFVDVKSVRLSENCECSLLTFKSTIGVSPSSNSSVTV